MGDFNDAMDGYGAQLAGQIIQVGAQNYSNRRAQKRGQEFAVEMYDKANAYNHPVQQMARLKEAGLNPALMYGKSGGTGQATAPGNVDMQPAQVPDLNAGLGYAELQLIKSNINNNKSQTDLNALRGASEAQNTALIKEQTGKTAAEKQSAQETAKLAEEVTQTALQAQLIDNQSKLQGIDQSKAQTAKTKAETQTITQTRKLTIDQLNANISKINKEIESLDMNINFTKAQADATYARKQLDNIKTTREQYKSNQDRKGLPVDGSIIGSMNAVIGHLISLIN